MEFCNIEIDYRSKPIFTPFINQKINIESVTYILQQWLKESNIATHSIFSGGSIITGLAAQADNASALSKTITRIVGDNIIATADDPCLESWLAFMGSCSALSRHHATTPILNFDIGGGTSNIAFGINGDVLETGCYFIGARHFQFKPGSYQLLAISDYGLALLKSLKIAVEIGEGLSAAQRRSILAFYVHALESVVIGNQAYFTETMTQSHCQVAISIDQKLSPTITFSGGVGELIYEYAEGKELPNTSYFGDFGIDLAIAIAKSKTLSKDLNLFIPENKGRATVYGLTLHSTEISGHTIYLPNPNALPLRDIPIIAKLALNNTDVHWHHAFALAAGRELGACIQIISLNTSPQSVENIRQLADKIKQHFVTSHYNASEPLLILVEDNIGKVLGNYISDWGQSMQNLIVIDEVALRHAHFVNVGSMHQQIVPVSFFGMH
jgi:ethanolamine utilization protein EutA